MILGKGVGIGSGVVHDEGLLPLFSISLIVRLSRVTWKGGFSLGVGMKGKFWLMSIFV